MLRGFLINKILILLFFCIDLSASYLEGAKILQNGKYDFAWSVMGAKSFPYQQDTNIDAAYSFRTGLGFLSYFDFNFEFNDIVDTKSLGFDLRLGLLQKQSLYGFRGVLSLGFFYSIYDSELYMYLKKLPIEFTVSKEFVIDGTSLELFTGIKIEPVKVNGVKTDTSFYSKGTVFKLYGSKVGLVIDPLAFKITKFILEAQLPLSNYSRRFLGSTVAVGLLISLQSIEKSSSVAF